jgi:hypothetical protein
MRLTTAKALGLTSGTPGRCTGGRRRAPTTPVTASPNGTIRQRAKLAIGPRVTPEAYRINEGVPDMARCNRARQVSYPINLLLIRNCVLLHHDSNEIIAELYFREAIINLEPMASMRPTAFERLAIAGHRVRFGQENDVDCLLEQIIFDFRFFQRLVRKQTRAPEDDGN